MGVGQDATATQHLLLECTPNRSLDREGWGCIALRARGSWVARSCPARPRRREKTGCTSDNIPQVVRPCTTRAARPPTPPDSLIVVSDIPD